MADVRLKILGLTVPIRRSMVYHDDGFVSSIGEHYMALLNKYILSALFTPILYNDNGIDGMHIIHPGIFKWHTHIFYLNKYSNVLNMRIRAHEETHALDISFNRLDLLADKILEEQNAKIDFDSIGGGEIRADIGAVYALLSNEIEPNKIRGLSQDILFNIAYRTYKKSMLPKRKIFV